jgi:hypothetical protein
MKNLRAPEGAAINIDKFIKDQGFQFAGKIRRISPSELRVMVSRAQGPKGEAGAKEQKIKIELNKDWIASEHVGLVYLWVVTQKKSTTRICYVGKAGKALNIRCGQHEQGFRGPDYHGSKSGLEKRNRLCEFLAAGFEVQVFAKASKQGKFFGQEVSLCASEEQAAIAACKAMNQDLFNS